MIETQEQHLRRLLETSFGVENVNDIFFHFLHTFRLTTFYVDVAFYYCDRFLGVHRL